MFKAWDSICRWTLLFSETATLPSQLSYLVIVISSMCILLALVRLFVFVFLTVTSFFVSYLLLPVYAERTLEVYLVAHHCV